MKNAKTQKGNYRQVLDHELLELDTNILEYIRPNTMISNFRLKNIERIVQYISDAGIKGDIVECGVWKGGAGAMMAYALKNKTSRAIHLFDIFDDIVEPDKEIDGKRAIEFVGGEQNARGQLKPIKGIYDEKGGHGNENHVFDLIANKIGYPEELIRIHKGLFQDTLPGNSIGKISFLRLDGDWYASTKVCLEYLYPKLVKGGVVVIDDYMTYEGCKKAVDEFLNNNNIPLL